MLLRVTAEECSDRVPRTSLYIDNGSQRRRQTEQRQGKTPRPPVRVPNSGCNLEVYKSRHSQGLEKSKANG
jgi:hypothetical protein